MLNIFKRAFLLGLFLGVLLSSKSLALIKVQDFRGKTITLEKPAERVVCLIESALTGIYMLKQGHRVIGVPYNIYQEGFYYTDTFKYYALLEERIKSKKIPAVGNWETVNVEKVLSLKPDLIIIWANQGEAIQTFERLKIPVYGVFISKIEDVYKEIRDLGLLLGAERRAEELINYVKKEVNEIRKIAKKIKVKRRVYFSWAQINFLQTSCQGSIVNELIEMVGGINICSHIKAESISLNLEKLLSLNPEVIIMWYSKILNPSKIFNEQQLRTIKAVKSFSVYQFENTFFYDLWTLKFLYSLKTMANWIYPEYFSFDLEKEKINIMNFLYGQKLI